MNKMTYDQLSAGIAPHSAAAVQTRLVEKWARSGLLRGLDGAKRGMMARLLENQCAQLLREGGTALSTGGANLVGSGQIAGFSTIAFPIVRKVFAGLVSGELVSMQPMSMPAGLIFYLDFTYGSNVGGNAGVGLSDSATEATYARGDSIYNNPVGKGIQSGSLATGGMYDLMGAGYSRVHSGSLTVSASAANLGAWTGANDAWTAGGIVASLSDFSGTNARMLNFDPQVQTDLSTNTLDVIFLHLTVAEIQAAVATGDFNTVEQIAIHAVPTANGATPWGASYQGGLTVYNLRRLNKRGNFSGGVFTSDPFNGTHIQFALRLTNGGSAPAFGSAAIHLSMALTSGLSVDSGTGSTVTIPSFESDFGTPSSPVIPELNMKIEQIAITAENRKLRIRWTPELAQDLNAYHALDAEVELTSVMSQEVALEIDREILGDLVRLASGANYYWSQAPGKFVNKTTGAEISLGSSLSTGPHFTGNIQDWYQGLAQTITDVANTIQRKTLRGSANFIVVGPDVSTILEHATSYRPKYSIDGAGQVATPFVIGAENIGTVANRFTVYRTPDFPRNKILVGFKGGQALETGYAYCPYVPIIMTQTVLKYDDFTPTKGVMTRYGKKMIRSDFYGTVTVTDMNII